MLNKQTGSVSDSDAATTVQNKEKMLGSLSMSASQRQPAQPNWFRRSAVSVAVMTAVVALYYNLKDEAPVSLVNEAQARPLAREPNVETTSALASARPASLIESKMEAQGFVMASRVATVSSRVLGVVRDVLVEAGDEVEAGQTLARLDDSHAQLELGLARSALEAIEARIKTANVDLQEKQLDLAREKHLLESGFASSVLVDKSKNKVDKSHASLEQLAADLNVARLRVEQQQSLLNDHVIAAPFNGVVVETSAQAGEVIAPSAAGGGFTRTGICTIVDMSSLQVVVEINEQMIDQIQADQPVSIQPLAYRDVSLTGRVDKILPRVNIARGTVEVRVELLEQDKRILPDMAVRVAFL